VQFEQVGLARPPDGETSVHQIDELLRNIAEAGEHRRGNGCVNSFIHAVYRADRQY
jgi:hypothetical protein